VRDCPPVFHAREYAPGVNPFACPRVRVCSLSLSQGSSVKAGV
jgi:hypothetical protein